MMNSFKHFPEENAQEDLLYRNLPNHYVYPAIIEQTDENYCLYFPDLPGCVASGDTVEKVVELAQSAAQEYLWELEHDNEEIPAATPTKSLSLNDGDAICITRPWAGRE